MQATTLGPNMTGASIAPSLLQAMNEAADELTPATPIDTSEIEAQRLRYIDEADAVGSVPPPIGAKDLQGETASAAADGDLTAILMDKLGERIAFERTGTRLYEALIVKHRAAAQREDLPLPPASRTLADGKRIEQEPAADALQRIRAEELAHFQLLCEAMEALGGDPTAMTPCADVTAVASSGLMQVLNDPRTTLAQCLGAMLTAELTDNAGWELLITLAEQAGQSQLTGRFLGALAQEQEHLATIKAWLTSIVAEDPRPAIV